MPCMSSFAAQDASYREAVLPPDCRARVALEAGVGMGWERWVGERGRVLSIDRYGASAPGEKVLAEYGFTVENVLSLARAVLA